MTLKLLWCSHYKQDWSRNPCALPSSITPTGCENSSHALQYHPSPEHRRLDHWDYGHLSQIILDLYRLLPDENKIENWKTKSNAWFLPETPARWENLNTAWALSGIMDLLTNPLAVVLILIILGMTLFLEVQAEVIRAKVSWYLQLTSKRYRQNWAPAQIQRTLWNIRCTSLSTFLHVYKCL